MRPVRANKVAWARFYLSKAGLIDGKKRGTWALTPEGEKAELDHAAALEICRGVQARFKTAGNEDETAPEPMSGHDLFADPNRRFWFVGAVWRGRYGQMLPTSPGYCGFAAQSASERHPMSKAPDARGDVLCQPGLFGGRSRTLPPRPPARKMVRVCPTTVTARLLPRVFFLDACDDVGVRDEVFEEVVPVFR
jgi:hypothetical protein